MLGRARAWVATSLGVRVAVIVLISGFMTNWASAHGWRAGWNHVGRSGRYDFVFLIPGAMIWGFACGIFLAKGWPRSFLSEREIAGRSREEGSAALYWFSWIAFGLFLAVPVIAVAYLFSLLGQPSY